MHLLFDIQASLLPNLQYTEYSTFPILNSDLSYVAVSSYVFLKYPKVLLKKADSYKKKGIYDKVIFINKLKIIAIKYRRNTN